MSEKMIKAALLDYLDKIAKVVSKGNDIEIRKCPGGIAVLEVSKKKV